MLITCINKLKQGKGLSAHESKKCMDEIIEGSDDHLILEFLSLLNLKGETSDELFGMIQSLHKKMISLPLDMQLLDIVGTGGDRANTINISTAAAIVAASCGALVAKHGNCAVSSKCGSANVLEKFGVNIEMSTNEIKNCIQNMGIGFCFAPLFHPALKKVKSVRKQLKGATTFNLLGPLLNPAKISYTLIGVYKKELMSNIAECVKKLKIKKAMIVHGNGLDELNLMGSNHVIEISRNQEKIYEIDPKKYGLNYCNLKDIQGGEADVNAQLILEVFEGKQGPIFDTILLNAGAALYISNKASTILNGINLAREKLLSGKAKETLNRWIDFSRKKKNE